MSSILVAIASGLVCLVFLRAALHKWQEREEFTSVVADYRILPGSLTAIVAALLPFLELLAALLLMVPAARTAGSIMSMILLTTYASAMGLNLIRGRDAIDCGCGGRSHGITWLHVFRNLLLSVLASFPLWLESTQHHWTSPGASWIATTAAACIGLLWLMFLLSEQLIGNYSHLVSAFRSRY